MTCKEVVRDVIDTLPEEASMDDIMRALYVLYVRTKFERGLQQVRNGEGISHEEAKKRFAQWLQ